MAYRGTNQMSTLEKFKRCSCGGKSKLIKRRNFPHGRGSKGVATLVYVCQDCNLQNLSIKKQEVRR